MNAKVTRYHHNPSMFALVVDGVTVQTYSAAAFDTAVSDLRWLAKGITVDQLLWWKDEAFTRMDEYRSELTEA